MTNKRKIEAQYNSWVSQMLAAQANNTTHLLPPEPARPDSHNFARKIETENKELDND